MDIRKPLVVHEEEIATEVGSHKGDAAVRWKTLLSSDRTPTAEIVLGVAEIAPGESGVFQRHQHDHVEAYYILSGCGTITLDNQDYQVRPGSTTFMPKGIAHGIVNSGPEVLRFLYVFPADSFGQIHYRFCES